MRGGWDDKIEIKTKINESLVTIYPEMEKGEGEDFYKVLYKAIREGRELPVTLEEARKVIEIIEAAYKSAQSGEVIRI